MVMIKFDKLRSIVDWSKILPNTANTSNRIGIVDNISENAIPPPERKIVRLSNDLRTIVSFDIAQRIDTFLSF